MQAARDAAVHVSRKVEHGPRHAQSDRALSMPAASGKPPHMLTQQGPGRLRTDALPLPNSIALSAMMFLTRRSVMLSTERDVEKANKLGSCGWNAACVMTFSVCTCTQAEVQHQQCYKHLRRWHCDQGAKRAQQGNGAIREHTKMGENPICCDWQTSKGSGNVEHAWAAARVVERSAADCLPRLASAICV